MTKEDKIKLKKERKFRRCQKRRNKPKKDKNLFRVWYENGKAMQICSYKEYGTCEYPCNGDC